MERDQNEVLKERLDRLERRYRTWRRAGMGAMCVTAALLMYGAYAFAQPPSTQPIADPPKAEALQVGIDDTGLHANYTNFFRVSGNPEEVIIDFGLSSQISTAKGTEPAKLTDRVVMNYYTAKKLEAVIQKIVARHEATYGELQLDPEKRKKVRD